METSRQISSLPQGLAKLNNHQLFTICYTKVWTKKKVSFVSDFFWPSTIIISTCTLPAPLGSITLLYYFFFCNNYFFFNIICTLLIYFDYGSLSTSTTTPAQISPPKRHFTSFCSLMYSKCSAHSRCSIFDEWIELNNIRQSNVNS